MKELYRIKAIKRRFPASVTRTTDALPLGLAIVAGLPGRWPGGKCVCKRELRRHIDSLTLWGLHCKLTTSFVWWVVGLARSHAGDVNEDTGAGRTSDEGAPDNSDRSTAFALAGNSSGNKTAG
jgi:hypothetical protein